MKTRDTLTSIALSFLTIHLFGTHARLLYTLNLNKHLQEFAGKIPAFSFITFNEDTISAMVFALAYSAMTAIILKLYDERAKGFVAAIATFAILDFFGVLIYYNTAIKHFNFFGALYYAFYTLATIAAIGYSRFQVSKEELREIADPPNENTNLYDEIVRLKAAALNQKQVAIVLQISESKVSRILNNQSQ